MEVEVTQEVIARIERAQVKAARASDVLHEPPERLAADFGPVLATINRGQPNTLFNRASALDAAHAPLVGDIVDWFARHDIPPRIDLAPQLSSPGLVAELTRFGLAPEPAGFMTRRVMVGPTNGRSGPDRGQPPRIMRATEADLGDYLDIQMAVWPDDGGERNNRLDRLLKTAANAGVSRYVARIDGDPAATGSLHVSDGIAWLSAGATLPRFRGLGCQSALIARRLSDAAAAGCRLAGSLVAAGSGSERNLMRVGFVTASDKEVWMHPSWMDHPFYRNAG